MRVSTTETGPWELGSQALGLHLGCRGSMGRRIRSWFSEEACMSGGALPIFTRWRRIRRISEGSRMRALTSIENPEKRQRRSVSAKSAEIRDCILGKT